jgi:tetratricopeptide (TPR) repeat protein
MGSNMRTAHQFVLVVVLSLVVAAVLLLPGREEHAAMLAGEGRHREAIALLERRLVDDPGNANLRAALGRSYAALGEIDRAIEAFDAYLAVRPDDLVARKRQAELFLHGGLTDRYLDALARLVATKPTPREVTRLIELYRLHGRLDDELATLRTYASKALLEPAQLERLGAILAARGSSREARQWLELAVQKGPPEVDGGRLLLLELLIQDHELDAAYQRAQAWMLAWRSPFLSGQLILRVAKSGLAAPASGLALRFVDMMPNDTFEVAGLLASKGRQDLAQAMLARWSDRAIAPTATQWRAFVQASVAVGDLHGPLLKLMQLVRSGSDAAAQGQLAEELANALGEPALGTIRPLLTNEALLSRPLFAAELSFSEGNPELARWFLNRTEPDRLSPERAETWLALLRRVETDADIFRRLAELWSDGRLPAQLVPSFADEALKLGHVEVYEVIWKAIKH